jgi:Tfp pilus assembly protein PilX
MDTLNYMPSVPLLRPTSVQARAQRGASLFVAIVALVIMTIAGFALMRSVDTGNIIAGNMAFRESTVNAADSGIEAAAAYLNGTIAAAPDANLPAGCTVGALPSTLGTCRYSARILPEDERGVPLIDWSSANIPVTSLNGNDVQYVVERLCNPDTAVTVELGKAAKNYVANSLCGISPVVEGSSKSGPKLLPSHVVEVMYRITVRVQGPRNTIATVQSIQGR